MTKVIKFTAVPFSRLQTNATQNFFHQTAEMSSTHPNTELSILTPIHNINISSQIKENKQTASILSDRLAKKKDRVLRNRLAAKVSREKWRLHKDLLEQQLQHLKLEKMRLLMENEQLRLQHNHLEEENLSLKKEWKESQEKGSLEDTLEHASFVNIPLQKEWVLPCITLLLMTLAELLNSYQFQHSLMPWKTSKISHICLNSVMPLNLTKNQICQLQRFLTTQTMKTFDTSKSSLNSVIPLNSTMSQMFLSALSHKT